MWCFDMMVVIFGCFGDYNFLFYCYWDVCWVVFCYKLVFDGVKKFVNFLMSELVWWRINWYFLFWWWFWVCFLGDLGIWVEMSFCWCCVVVDGNGYDVVDGDEMNWKWMYLNSFCWECCGFGIVVWCVWVVLW